MSEDGKFLSIDQLEEKFNISKNIMKFNSIISAVKHAGKQNVYNSYKLLNLRLKFPPTFSDHLTLCYSLLVTNTYL
jgi:hypothetical protein